MSKMVYLAKRSYEQKQSGLLSVVGEAACRFADETDYTKMASSAELWKKENPGLCVELEKMLIDKVLPRNSSIHFVDSQQIWHPMERVFKFSASTKWVTKT